MAGLPGDKSLLHAARSVLQAGEDRRKPGTANRRGILSTTFAQTFPFRQRCS